MRALEKLSDEALGVLRTVAMKAEEDAPAGPVEFWSWLRALAWHETAKRHAPGEARPEPGFPTMNAEQLEQAGAAIAAMVSHEELRPTDQAAPALADCFAEIAEGLALMRRHVTGPGEVRH